LNFNIKKSLLVLLAVFFFLALTIRLASSESENPRPRWIFRSYWTDSFPSPYYEIAVPKGAGSPRLFYCPKNKDNWYEAQMTVVTFEDVPWLRWGMGGSGERKIWFSQEPETKIYLTTWYDDLIDLGSNWSLRNEVEFRYWLEKWGEAGLVVHQIFFYHQQGDFEMGAVIVGQILSKGSYQATGAKIAYSPLSWLSISLEGYLLRSPRAPKEELTLELSF